MARWMVTKGARNLVLISRSGSATGKVKEFVDELTALGANILVRSCDVADKKSVDNLLSNELGNMPPVRGVVHGAMVLRVSRSFSQPFRLSNMIRMSCSRK
jgi:short-subunit dehydrogenase